MLSKLVNPYPARIKLGKSKDTAINSADKHLGKVRMIANELWGDEEGHQRSCIDSERPSAIQQLPILGLRVLKHLVDGMRLDRDVGLVSANKLCKLIGGDRVEIDHHQRDVLLGNANDARDVHLPGPRPIDEKKITWLGGIVEAGCGLSLVRTELRLLPDLIWQ